MLQSITDAILTRVGLDELLRELVRRLQRGLEVDTAAILLRENGALVPRAAAGLEDEVERGLRIPLGRGFAGRIAAQGQPAILEDVDRADIFNPLLRQTGLKSMLGVPLLAGGTVRGVLHVGSRRLRQFESHEIRLLQRAAEQIAPAIEHARAREADRRLIDSLRALNELVATLHAAGRIEQVMQAIADVAQGLSGGGQAFAGFFRGRGEPQPTEYRQWEVAGAPRAVFEHLDHLHITPLFAPTFEGRGTVRSDDIHTHPLFQGLPEGHIPVRSYLAVPVMLQSGQVLGAILLGHPEPGRFDEETQHHLESLTRHAALALEKALLHERERAAADTLQRSREAEKIQREAAEQAADRMGRLQAITAGLMRTFVSPAEVAQVVIEHVLPIVGGWGAFVTGLTPDRRALELIGSVGMAEDVVQYWHQMPLDAAAPVAEVARTQAPVYLETHRAMLDRYPQVRDARPPLPPAARAILPLAVSGEALGVLTLLFPEHHRFADDQRSFLQTVAQQCALALERARLYAREHHVAATLQQALLPETLPEIPGIRLDAVYQAAGPEADVGGDWYDAFQLPDGRLALTVGDVAGHGLDAAVLMGEMRHGIRAAALAGHNPAKVLQVADTVLRTGGGRMATAVVIIVDPVKLTFVYAAAGHPPPVLATHNGIEMLEQGTVALGFGEGLPMAPEPLPLPSDGLLVLYTDGLIELDRDLVRGVEALHSAVAKEYAGRFDEPAHAILNRVTAGRPAFDDIAILTVAVDRSTKR
ncbi:MAG TPA: GAF domain-containing protein [bacterium]|nr:GAF domain-containing protein [bacterium]